MLKYLLEKNLFLWVMDAKYAVTSRSTSQQSATSLKSQSTTSTTTPSPSQKPDVVIVSWYNDIEESPFYKCAIATKYLKNVGIFTPLFSGPDYKENKTKQFRVVHKTGTKENVIVWLKFRQWITDGFNGVDPRMPSVDAYMFPFADYINDCDFTKTYFPGVNIKCILIYNHITERRGDDIIDFIETTDEMGKFSIDEGLKSEADIRLEILGHVNGLLDELKSMKLVAAQVPELVQLNEHGQLIVNPLVYCNPSDKFFECDMFMFGFKITFECTPIKKSQIEKSQNIDDIDDKDIDDKDIDDKGDKGTLHENEIEKEFGIISKVRDRTTYINYDRQIDPSFYVIQNNERIVSVPFLKLRFKVSIENGIRELLQKTSWTKDFDWKKVYGSDRFHTAKKAITRMSLMCDVKFEEFGVKFNSSHPLAIDFPNTLSNEIASKVLTSFVYGIRDTVQGNGFMKLRKFGLCEDNMARMVWSSDAENVCKILQIPNRSIGSCSKKKFEDLFKFCESVLRQKYGYTDFYDFDDPELKRLEKLIEDLNKKLGPHWATIDRCGMAGLEKANVMHEEITESEGPGKLYASYLQAEKQHSERYKKLIANAKKKEQKESQDYSRYDYLCKKK